MKILFLSGREAAYPRNDVLVRALRRLGSVKVIAGTLPGGLGLRSLQVAVQALPHLLSARYDLVVVGFYGHLLMLPVGLLSRAPVLFDAFVSTYDTLVGDRERFSPESVYARFAHWLDESACRRSDHVLIDTPEHRAYFMETFAVPGEKISALPVGCNQGIFFPRVRSDLSSGEVFYYATYQPLHGVDVVVRAALELADLPDLEIRVVGRGQEYPRVAGLAIELGVDNIEFHPPVGLEKLAGELGRARIFLGGHFGSSAKASRVIPGKVYQALAMARPLIAADTPANRGLLTHREHAWLVPPADPVALAAAIRALWADPEGAEAMARRGRQRFQACCSEPALTRKIARLASRLFSLT